VPSEPLDPVEPSDALLTRLEANATTPAMRQAYSLLRFARQHLACASVHISAAERATESTPR
jgi:hypothetical protein